ncbi:Alpha/Beta hydrolase protein [Armillaria luteobubalina]|uniref:Alpha/Beta hydrolase protein n=1 Tax=Armillaria luteobubalina TaxID=153913 RepID=A0AA39PU32_9AGAR|nr:Alpha/Beta hydrolase protein [Armillaria luteobubalina]
MECTPASVTPTLNISTCIQIKTRMNPYDMSRECDGDYSETGCYPMTKHISEYLSLPSIRSLLGVDPEVPQDFSSCNSDIIASFHSSQDEFYPSTTKAHLFALLERGIKVLIYAGALDWVCNWVGNERWTLTLEWSGRKEFSGDRLREWYVGGNVAGKTRSAKGLTFATVVGAGHFAPYDKPKETLALLQRWMVGEAL